MESKSYKATLLSRSVALWRRSKDDMVPLFAARASFFICVSAIPLLILVLSLSRAISPGNASGAAEILRRSIPGAARELFDTVAKDSEESGENYLVPFAAAGLLWTASRGVASLLDGLYHVYGTKKRGGAVSRAARSVFYTAAFAAVASAALTSVVIEREALRGASLFLTLTALFALIYKRAGCPALRRALPGALFASSGWAVFSLAYSYWFEAFPKHLYGSLASAVFFMLWVYFCVLILLVGAELTK